MTTETMESTSEAVESFAEVTAGAVKAAAEVASDPVAAAKRQVKTLERKGRPVIKQINTELNHRINKFNRNLEEAQTEADKAIRQLLPERLALRGVSLIKAQAREKDARGRIAHQALRFVHASARSIAASATRFEKASQLHPTPARKPATRKASRRRAVRKTATA